MDRLPLALSLPLFVAGCASPIDLAPAAAESSIVGSAPDTAAIRPMPVSTTPADPSPATPVFADREVGLVRQLINGSRRLRTLRGREAHALAERLEPHSRRVYFEPGEVEGMADVGVKLHRVEDGEYPYRIAERYAIDAWLIARLNPDKAPTDLQIRDRLKVVDLSAAAVELVLHVARHRIAVWRIDGATPVLMAYLPVSDGSDVPAPRPGATRVVRRLREVSAGAGGVDLRRLELDAEPFDRRSLSIGDGERDTYAMATDDLDRVLAVVSEGARVRIDTTP